MHDQPKREVGEVHIRPPSVRIPFCMTLECQTGMADKRLKYPASEALKYLRANVVAACAMVFLALAIHVLVWAFATYTEVSYMQVQRDPADRPAVVIVQGNETQIQSTHANTMSTSGDLIDDSGAIANEDVIATSGPVNANRTQSPAGIWLLRTHRLAVVIGIAGLILLACETTLGVVVASGVATFGIGNVVRAQFWSLILIATLFPWGRFLTDAPYSGFFIDYDETIRLVDAYQSGTGEGANPLFFFGQFLVLPGLGFSILCLVAWSFYGGVAGALVSSKPSKFEIEIENEATDREAGTVGGSGRADGAFRTVMDVATSGAESSSTNPLHQPPVGTSPTSLPLRATGTDPDPASLPLFRPGSPSAHLEGDETGVGRPL